MKGIGMKERPLGVNALLNGIKQCCAILFPLITFPYVSRILGSGGFGKYSFSASVTNYFVLLAALGIDTYAIREGAKVRADREKVSTFCSQIFSINVCSALVSLTLLAGVLLLPKFQDYKPYILIQSTAMILAAVGTDWVNGIYEDYFYITVRYIAVQCICLGVMFLLVRSPEDLIPYCVVSVLASNGGKLINILHVRKFVRIRFTFRMSVRKHLPSLLVLFANAIAVSVYVNSDIIMLGFFESDAQVGIYSFVSKIYSLLKRLINAAIVVSVPRIAYLLKNEPGEYEKYVKKVFSMLSMILLPVTVGMFFMSDTMIRIAGGQQYMAGDAALKILSAATLFAIYASLFTNCVLIVNGQEKKCLCATAWAAVTNVGLNFLLIPPMGMLGAAITTGIAEMVNCVMQIRFSKPFFDWKNLDFKSVRAYLWGSGLVGAVCAACNAFIGGTYLRMATAMGISCVVYGAVLLAMKNQFAVDAVRFLKSKRGKRAGP